MTDKMPDARINVAVTASGNQMTVAEAARRFGLKRQRLEEAIKAGNLESAMVPFTVMVRVVKASDVKRYLKTVRRGRPKKPPVE